jgi:hypothetical protein
MGTRLKQLLNILTHPATAFVAAFFAYSVATNHLIGPDRTTCKDDWRSPSIGTQGACSHHGGVQGMTFRRLMRLVFAGGVAFGAFYYRNREREPKKSKEPQKPENSKLKSGKGTVMHKGCPVLGERCKSCQSVTELNFLKLPEKPIEFFWVCPATHTCGKFEIADTKVVKALMDRLLRKS